MVGTVEFALKPDLDEQHHDGIEKVAAILVRDNSMKKMQYIFVELFVRKLSGAGTGRQIENYRKVLPRTLIITTQC